MTQKPEIKTNAKMLTLILGAASLVFGLLITLYGIIVDFVGLIDYFSIMNIIYNIFYFCDDFILTVLLPALLIALVLFLHKKGKSKLVISAIFAILALHTLFFAFVYPIVEVILDAIAYGTSFGFVRILSYLFVGSYRFTFSALSVRFFDICALICFAAAAFFSFKSPKNNAIAKIFDLSYIIGAACSVLSISTDFLSIIFNDYFTGDFLNYGYTLGSVFGPILIICYWLWLLGSVITFMAGLVIFLIKNKAEPQNAETIAEETYTEI